MPLQFCANISLLFTELPFLQRFEAAKQAGFSAVEIQFPYEYNLAELVEAKTHADIDVVLINVPAGDLMTGGEGLASVPDKVDEYEAALITCMEYAIALDVSRVNVLPGRCFLDSQRQDYMQTFMANLRATAQQFTPLGITTCFEAINQTDMPHFLISDVDQMLQVLDSITAEGVGLQYDVYHMAMMNQPVIEQLKTYMNRIAHIQFADCPGRHEPGTGHVDFVGLFSAIEDSDYSGWESAEYKPSVITEDTLYWL